MFTGNGLACEKALDARVAIPNATTIIFHLRPIELKAAVNGQPPTGFGREELNSGAFLIEIIATIIFTLESVNRTQTLREVVMIVEVRSYRVKPGKRDVFIEFF